MPVRNDPQEEPIARWRARLRQRPAVAAALAAMLPGPFSYSPVGGGQTCGTRTPSVNGQQTGCGSR